MLREAVASVLAQTWRPIEVIIVDDGSTDDTLTVAEALRSQHPSEIRVLRRQNGGPGAARQFGLEAAAGEFIQFLDSDDLLLPDKFSQQVQGLQRDREADIAYGKQYASENGHRLSTPSHRTGERLRTLFPSLLQGRIWHTTTPLYRHSAMKAIGPWPLGRQLEDWEYDAQAAAACLKLFYVDGFVAETRSHGGERLCHAWLTDDRALRDMASAYLAISRHAKSAGIDVSTPDARHFVRSLFWMARVAGQRGLEPEAKRLIQAAKVSSDSNPWDVRVFELIAQLVGWRRASVVAERLVQLGR